MIVIETVETGIPIGIPIGGPVGRVALYVVFAVGITTKMQMKRILEDSMI